MSLSSLDWQGPFKNKPSLRDLPWQSFSGGGNLPPTENPEDPNSPSDFYIAKQPESGLTNWGVVSNKLSSYCVNAVSQKWYFNGIYKPEYDNQTQPNVNFTSEQNGEWYCVFTHADSRTLQSSKVVITANQWCSFTEDFNFNNPPGFKYGTTSLVDKVEFDLISGEVTVVSENGTKTFVSRWLNGAISQDPGMTNYQWRVQLGSYPPFVDIANSTPFESEFVLNDLPDSKLVIYMDPSATDGASLSWLFRVLGNPTPSQKGASSWSKL